MSRRIIIVGGVAAGMSAALAARRQDRDAEIVIFEKSEWASYVAPVIPEKLARPDRRVEEAIVVVPDELWSSHGIGLRTQHEVTAVDVAARALTVRDLRFGRDSEQAYDSLVLATGATLEPPAIAGRELPGVFGLRTLGQGLALQEHLAAQHPRTACVIGDDAHSLASAQALRERGLAVTLVCPAGRPLPEFHPASSRAVARELEHHGVRVVTSAPLSRIEQVEHGLVVTADDEVRVPAEIVVFAGPPVPSLELARDAGLNIHLRGGIDVDEYQHTSAPDVYAAGECAVSYHRLLRREVWLPLPALARRQGEVAGINAAGGRVRFPGTLAAQAARIFDLEVARVGLTRAELDELGEEHLEEQSLQSDRSAGEPGARSLSMVLHVSRRDGLLLAAEMFGPASVVRRVDVFGTAIFAGLTVEDVAGLDLAYAPHAGPLTDAVAAAAESALRRLEAIDRIAAHPSAQEGDRLAFDASSP
jgi:NADPH-dependent 2,4-dienoyl-CoA reductase/sulfur reductase-like enzyme